MASEAKRTLVIADPLALVCEALAALCERGGVYRVVGHCTDGAAAAQLVSSLRPTLAILDLSLPRLFTLEAVRRVREAGVPAKFVILSTRRDRKTVVEVLRGGASAYVLKSAPAADLLEALAQVHEGGIYVARQLEIEQIFLRDGSGKEADPLQSLSTREFQVFSLMVEGIRAKEIAARLELSPKTVDTYRASLMRKLDIHDLAGLVKFAIGRQLTAPP